MNYEVKKKEKNVQYSVKVFLLFYCCVYMCRVSHKTEYTTHWPTLIAVVSHSAPYSLADYMPSCHTAFVEIPVCYCAFFITFAYLRVRDIRKHG